MADQHEAIAGALATVGELSHRWRTRADHLNGGSDRHGARLGYRVPTRGAITDVAPPTEVASV
nr:hypothetical protein KitaXyl93_09420 [Kitasatospora sp. Xyl93]